ncbi:MAG: hypothetical protein ACTSP3_14210 [Candidatus Heimdallarchaeaceae archaeon]
MEIPIQVKSSYREESEKNYTQKGILYLVVRPYHKHRDMKNNIINMLKKVQWS